MNGFTPEKRINASGSRAEFIEKTSGTKRREKEEKSIDTSLYHPLNATCNSQYQFVLTTSAWQWLLY